MAQMIEAQAFTAEELQLATRNRGMPLEALRYDLTPTGLHYLLIHFDVQEIEPASWHLSVDGNVQRNLEFTLDDIRAMPSVTLPVTMECAGNGRAQLSPRPVSQPWLNEACSTAEWTGTPLVHVLEAAGLKANTMEVVFTGADRGIQDGVEHSYERSLTLDEAMRPEVLLAYEMNGQPLQPQHGFPLRLLVPGWYGMASVKWLKRIEAITEPFEGFQQQSAYLYQSYPGDSGRPVQRIQVRALMVPPGIPDFFTRRRQVKQSVIELSGRAWSGVVPIVRVEVGVDGVWRDASLHDPIGEFAWRGWSYEWDAAPGTHHLSCRATDDSGNIQPLEQPWNLQGMGNNLVQTIEVEVV